MNMFLRLWTRGEDEEKNLEHSGRKQDSKEKDSEN